MADEESKYFSLTEAERLRVKLEPILIEAMESRRKMSDVDDKIGALAEKISTLRRPFRFLRKSSQAPPRTQSARTGNSVGSRAHHRNRLCRERSRRRSARFSRAHRRPGRVLVLETGRGSHPLLSPPGRRLFRPQAHRPARPRPQQSHSVIIRKKLEHSNRRGTIVTDAPENRLKDSASPYLRSAAHQPIDWHEWGAEAFANARAEENKPILLDIGAVWCHWCHVIDRESYENPEIAAHDQQILCRRESRSRRAPRCRRPLPVRHQRHIRPGRLAAHRLSHARKVSRSSVARISRRKTPWAAPDSNAFCSASRNHSKRAAKKSIPPRKPWKTP